MRSNVIVKKVINCSRCGIDHDNIDAMRLERPFAPPEASPVRWTHWSPCPSNGQPIMFVISDTNADSVDESYQGSKR